MELLCVVLISLRDSSLDSLSEERLLERREVVQNLVEAKFNLFFLWGVLVVLGPYVVSEEAF